MVVFLQCHCVGDLPRLELKGGLYLPMLNPHKNQRPDVICENSQCVESLCVSNARAHRTVLPAPSYSTFSICRVDAQELLHVAVHARTKHGDR